MNVSDFIVDNVQYLYLEKLLDVLKGYDLEDCYHCSYTAHTITLEYCVINNKNGFNTWFKKEEDIYC